MKYKFLYLLRHAKAESGQDDHERALASRGREDARAMGQYLARQGIWPERVLCSTAVRCVETLNALFPSPSGPHPNPLPEGEGIIEYANKLYLASANELLTLIAATPESISRLMLIGHNPGMHELCLRLAREGDTALLRQLHIKFPTCALAAIEVPGRWSGLRQATGRLKLLMTPKMLAATPAD